MLKKEEKGELGPGTPRNVLVKQPLTEEGGPWENRRPEKPLPDILREKRDNISGEEQSYVMVGKGALRWRQRNLSWGWTAHRRSFGNQQH